jgi:hypothetical protein
MIIHAVMHCNNVMLPRCLDLTASILIFLLLRSRSYWLRRFTVVALLISAYLAIYQRRYAKIEFENYIN